MGAIDDYLARTRRLLSDPNANQFQNPELIDDINQARNRVASDSKCLRTLIKGVNLAAGQEVYNVTTDLNGGTPTNLGLQIVEVFSVTIYWGNMRVICQNRSFTEQNAKLRIFQTYQTRPGSLAMLGQGLWYVNPVPDQVYVSDWDVAIIPPALAISADAETIPVAWRNPVPFYAAKLAKFGEQSMGESDIYFKEFVGQMRASSWATMSTRFRDAYRR